MIMKVAEWTPASLLSLGSQATSGPINSIVTNVPGPQFPLYLQGAKLLSIFPQVPLLGEMGVGIALMSYNGRIGWGFNANPDVIPDLDVFIDLIKQSLQKLADICATDFSSERKSEAHTNEGSPTQTLAVKADRVRKPAQRNGSLG